MLGTDHLPRSLSYHTQAHQQHRWGHSMEAQEIAALSLASACVHEAEGTSTQPESPENSTMPECGEHSGGLLPEKVMEYKKRRNNRAICQLLVVGMLGGCSICIYLAIRLSRSLIFGGATTGVQTFVMSLIDVARIYLMQYIGREVLALLALWDDDIFNQGDKAAWQLWKYLLFEFNNNFCALFFSVGYQAFSAGTAKMNFVEAPACFSPFCQFDIEVYIWTLVGIKYFLVPLIMSAYTWWKFTTVRRKRLAARLYHDSADVGNARKGAQAGSKQRVGKAMQTTMTDPITGATVSVPKRRTGIMALILGTGGPPQPMISYPDVDGDFGETPLEAQQDLTPYNPHVWEVRRPLDLVMVIAFIGQCSTLAPLLSLAGVFFVSLKCRLDALELIVTTSRPPVNRNVDIVVWIEALSWVALVSVLATSVSIMFATPDVEALILKLATSYRASLMMNPAFKADALNCVAGICLDANENRAEGSLYWVIWIVIVALGLAIRTLSQVLFRIPSLWILRHEQVEHEVQTLLGLDIAHQKHDDDSGIVLEEFMMRYNKAVWVDPFKFEQAPN